jgi:hypothetical protein
MPNTQKRNPDRSVGIAIGYGLGAPGIESHGRFRFSAPIQTGPGAHPASYTKGTGYLSWGSSKGRGVAFTAHPHLAPKVKKEWSCTFTPPSEPPRLILGWNFTFLFVSICVILLAYFCNLSLHKWTARKFKLLRRIVLALLGKGLTNVFSLQVTLRAAKLRVDRTVCRGNCCLRLCSITTLQICRYKQQVPPKR